MAGDGLRGIRTGTPVPSVERESAPTRNDVQTDNWGPDGVAKYIEERFGEKLRRCQSGRRPLNLNLKREDEGEMALFTLSREEYLDERRAGKTRQEIAKEHGINLPGLRYHLRKWDLLDPAIEEAEMDKSSESAVAVATEAKEPEPIDVEMHYEKSTTADASDMNKNLGLFEPQTLLKAWDKFTEVVGFTVPPYLTPANHGQEDETGHFVTVRIRVDFNGWPKEISDLPAKQIDRDQTIRIGAQMMQNAVGWAWKELTDILGPGDYTAQVEQYIERKLVALAE